MDPRRLEELIAGHFDGTLTDEQRAELESVLRTDPNARRLLARAAQTHLDLSLLLGHRLPDIPAARGNRRIAYGAAAAILLVAAGALLWVVRPPAAPQTYRLIEETGLRDVHALPYGRDILAGMGTTLPLDGGAVEFLAPTIVSLSEERVDLKAGHARFRLSGGNARLCVATPAGTLRDIGTTFEVQVSRRMGEEDLVRQFRAGIVRTFVTAVVLTGAVEFQSTAQDPPRKLTPEMGTVPLSADASIGRVRDREGIAGLKPVMADRWTVAEENAPLERGTWVRTGTRGANAVTLTLSNQAQLILGPATLVELVDPENIRLVQGELEVTSPQKANVKVTGPGATSLDVSGTQVLRARDGKLSPLESQPRWLEGYKNNASTEALGSLLADVDGRNVPLEIGTHIVTVDIRDQIARTEIEESFINTTDRRLEGVFYFPLPQDASISGFGMWIGDELVHADIVEKQRAREIYETILSERRDPGLLEWTGGNIFKARVFPIDREKRIKISYTEVLPKTGGAYRYFYRLQSEMLRLHPLKKLKIDVKIHSQEALQSVTCPSHDCRIATTESSARVEFEAGEYVPDRDFEVRVAPKRETPPISVVTHRRGNDGTFLMFINPIERDTESRAEPLTLLVMADTSGSMAGAPREAQLAFVEALLSSLSEKDRFNLLTCDVTSGWAFEQPRENTKENREAALGVLEKRHPLGWSDLDQAFDSVLQRVQEGDHVVYVGDGAITTGDAHPVAFAKRLRRRYQVGTFHAVAPGSSYESVVLKTIAECGGGSWRVVGGGQDPAQAADRLLREIASPGLRGARLSFTGVPVAAVYPEMLPNLPSDMQQIIVGRYDPTAGAALGKVTVRGTLDGKPVEHGGEFVLGAADAGNSFIPRLWARHHLDHLLAQGDTPEIRDRIIALSEDYQIITPYTSFLVLESDADRERFKVRKRFLMRDGEEFFAKGRENADFELGRKQMLAAKLWRRELRNHVLAWLAEMGRESARGYDIRGVGITDVDEYGAGAFRGGERLERDFREPVSGPVEVFADLDEMNELAENEVPSGQWAAGYDLKKVPPAGGKLSRNKRGWDGYVVTEESSPSGFDSLFPTLPDPPQNPAEPEWPQEVLDIIRSLDRRPKISPLTDGLKIVVASERSSVESILSKDAWVVTPLSEPGFDFEIPWCTTTERGVIRATWLLGRVRDKLDGDAVAWPGPFPWYFGEILQSHATCRLELKALEGGRVELTLRHPQSPALATVLLIDPAEATILEVRQVMGNFTSIVSYEDFVEVAGALWPQTQVSRDGNGKIIGAPVTISVSVIAQKDLAAEIDARLAIRKQALLLGKTPQTIAQAKQAVKAGKDRLEDRWVLLREYAATQQWGKANPHLAAIAKIASDKLGLVAIRLTWHRESRRGEELRGLIMEAARELATNPRAADYACAEHLLQAAAAFHQGNERLEIAWLLRPVYERRREIAGAMAQWDRHVLNSLYAMGRHDEAFAKLREMAGHHAADPSIQREYAQALVQRGEVDAALKHLSSMETETACHILFQSYRLESLVAYVDEKMPQQDLTSQVLNQYLSALIMLDREDEAWKRIESWLDTDNRKRIEAAVQYAIGRGYNLYSYRRRLDDKHADMLARAVRRLSAHSTSVLYAGQILSSADFLSTDVGRALQKEFFDRLAKGTTTLPADEIQRLVGLVRHHYMPDEGEASWQRIFSEIAQRWEREAAEDQKTVLAAVISSYGPAELQIDYWRKVLASASTDAQRQQAAQMLFTLLMGGPWTRENEAELTRLLSPSSAFLQFATWLPSARAEAAVQALPNVNEMPRRELKAAREQALKEARTAAIDLFRGLETQKELETIKPWIRVERLYLQAKIKQDLRSVHADAMAALREILKGGEEHRALALRLVATLMYVGTLEEAGREEVLSFLKEADGDVLDWKEMTYRFLIALDRGDELEAMLKEWTGDDFEKIRWGRDTAMILAERNRIDEAVALFEHIETVDELEHQDYRTLADWYMVQGRPDKRRVARIKSWQALSEYALSADLQREYGKVHRGGDSIPCELDEEIPFKFIALFRKSQDPRNCVWLLQQYYDSTRDFRLLECLPEAVLGQSAQRIYPFLAGLRAVTDKLQEEATLDRLSKHLAALHAQAESDVDRRALRLLEFAVERRACDQSHGAQPHVTAALRALKEAEGGTWADGEAEMMAGFLASQGSIVPAALAEEQLRQLRALHQGAAPGTEARLTIAGHAASALWSHGQKDAAVRILGPALDERRQANGGLLPVSANDPLSAYAGYREGMGEYATAEEVWLAELRSPRLAQQNLWLKEQLFAHYQRAYADQAEVSLGKGDALYAAAYARLLEELLRPSNEHHAHQLIQTLCGMWLARPSEPVRESSIEFAFKVLPRVLAMYQYRQGQESVSVVTQALEKIHGPKKVVAFLVDRAESEPRWLRLQNQGFWSRHGATLAHAIARAKPLDPALEERALAVVARELREDLRSGLRIHGGAYHDDHGDFWAEKKEEFARVAREVLAERPRSEGRITHVATYLYEGLSLASEAIDLLAGAHRDALLGLESTHLLTRYLQEQNRYAESVPILERLVAQRPDRLEFHIMLMRGHFHTGASERLQEVRKAADAYFHASGRWTEQVIATLGQACLETRLHAECADYLREAIALHVKTAPNRGVGDGQLAAYYRVAAGAYAGLGMTAKAVDAAAGAIVSWGRDIHQRAQDLARLEEVLEAAQDRDAYAAQLSAEAEKTGLENPIVRKALANVYLKRGEPAKAIEQARLAVANQPDDMETRRMLVQALDAAGKRQEATVELLAAVAVAGHDVAIPKELGDRWKNAGDPGEAERAYTNMVEVSAGESEGHEALARVRESEARWPEAEAQWHQVIRVRTNEPAGYVGLARVLIQMRKWDEARAIVDKLRTTSWPSRFGDVRSAANEIEELLKSRK